jgi:pimeloyl-ACP methyl ester carboxylesterase
MQAEAVPVAADRPAGRRKRARRWFLLLLVPLALAYVIGFAYLYLVQDRLIFPVRPLSSHEGDQVLRALPGVRSVRLTARDGTALHAWYRPWSGGGPHRVLVYFGASSEQVHWQLAARPEYDGWDLLLIDYRGYGLSEGRPGQVQLEDDAALWLDQAASGGSGIARADRLVVMGTSMGSYFATHMAATHRVDGVVLVVPADSVRSLVQSMLPFYPVGLLLKHPFDSMADAPSVHAPTVFLVAMNDELVSVSRARRLYEHWGSQERQWVELPRANHYTAASDPAYWRTVGEFLRAR